MISKLIETPLGPMWAAADKEALYHLEFYDGQKGEMGQAEPLQQIERELKLYFQGKLKEFKTPLALKGTPFQKQVWEELLKIPYGQTISYKDLAIAVENPRGCRAVAQANGANNLAVIIPCHRVINHNGGIGGYGGGLDRKKWLLDLEITYMPQN